MRQPGKPASKTPLLVDYVLRAMPFPPALLGFLEDLPDDSAPEEHATAQQQARAVEPPRKKARRNAESVSDHVPIAEESFDIERPCWPQLLKSQPRLAFTKPQANRCMQLHCTLPAYTPGEHAIATELIISGQHRSRIKSTLALYSLVSPKAACILRVASRSRDNQETEGGVWVAFDIGLERKDGTDRISLRLQLMWNPTRSVYTCIRSAHQRALCQEIADNFFPPDMLSGTSQYGPSPQAFYDATCAPDADYTDLLSVPVPMLVSELYPFQQRALQWLLEREGVRWSQGQLVPYSKEASSDLPFSFHRIHSTDSRPAYASTVYHVVTRDLHPFWEMETSFRGGILSEEMGLGKTVEMIALMLMHRRPPHPPFVLDHHSGNQVRPTGATLIVTPTNLKNQWLSEMDKHAPGMRVTYYGGIKQHSSGGDELVKELAEHDVVVTTYSVLQAEIHFAVEPPKRAMRHERKHPRPMSPLVQLSWWRVCLDEAQQIESGVSAAAKVARTIPRVNAWGVTGTPVKDNVKDLWGLLLFLRYEPFASHPWTWDTLASTHGHMFRALFNRIAMRHTKRAVRNELVLPPQKRFILTMPFTAVEEQNYKTQFGTLAQGCGLDTTGAPLVRDWNPDDPTTLDSMRRALAQLRQTVLHPELGPGRIRGMTQRNKPLRTIDEVLDAMIEQTEYAIKADQRQGLNNKIRRGQLFENSPRVKEALAIWEEALEEAKLLVAECREQLKEETEKAREDGAENIREDGDDDAQDVPPRLGEARRRLKLALGIEHKAIFFIASAYFQIKTDEDMTPPDSNEFKRLEKLEAEGYELAKGIRKEILRDVHAKAERYMSRLSEDAETQSFVEIPEFKSVPHKALEGRNILDNLEKLGAILDEQANMIDGWRERVVQLLLRPLVDEEGEAEITGEEYGDSTMIQDELMIYTLVLRAAIADRQDALSGLKNERVKHETRSAELLAKEGEGPAPETLLELLQLRRDMKPSPGHGSFRSVITNLRELATKLRHDVANGSNRAAIELEIIQQHLKLTQEHIAKQTKAANGLEKELDRFSDAMNTRIEYYRQLQQVSDTVAPWEREEDGDMDAAHLSDLLATEKAIQQRITSAQSKYRYLLSLKKSGENRQEPKLCVICQSNFTLGVLTLCGHQFCKECIMLWYRAHRNCPVCKKQLTSEMLHDISLKPESKLKVVSENHASSTNADLSHHVARRSGIYSEFSEDKLQEIRKVELDGPSFGTKVDMLIRHLMWLRQEDPGAKSIVFSQFKSFLDILGRAFRHYRVGYSTFDSKDGITRFKDDPSIECFLMDARAHASGLNLVNASHVFLCEPLLNTALELQAIARVDRIGQEHDTTVWLYLVEGTVEESIYNLSVQRRMEHMAQSPTTSKKGKSKEATPDVSDLNLEAANSMELQQAALNKLMSKDQQLGEVVDKNDVWECLFGHLAAETRDQTTSTKMDERFDDPAVVGFLAGEAAAARRDGASRA